MVSILFSQQVHKNNKITIKITNLFISTYWGCPHCPGCLGWGFIQMWLVHSTDHSSSQDICACAVPHVLWCGEQYALCIQGAGRWLVTDQLTSRDIQSDQGFWQSCLWGLSAQSFLQKDGTQVGYPLSCIIMQGIARVNSRITCTRTHRLCRHTEPIPGSEQV